MPDYNYECLDCKETAFAKHSEHVTEDAFGDRQLPDEMYESLILFQTSHPMSPTEEELLKATECPRCKSTNAVKTVYGCRVSGYTKGYGWLDKAGVKRDMNRHKLANDDPYAQYRVPGEVDHIDNKLKKAGQHGYDSNGNSKRRHYGSRTGKTIEDAVDKVVSKPPPKSDT